MLKKIINTISVIILFLSFSTKSSFAQSGQNGPVVWQVGNNEIWYQDYVNGGVATKLFTSDRSIDRIQVSPNGKFVSFRKNERLIADLNLAYQSFEYNAWTLWVINFDINNPNPKRFYSNIDFGSVGPDANYPNVFDHSWDKSGNFIYVGMSSTSATFDNFILKLSFPRPNVTEVDPVKTWKIGDNYQTNGLLFTHSNDGYFYYKISSSPYNVKLGRVSSSTSNTIYNSRYHRYWESNGSSGTNTVVSNTSSKTYDISDNTKNIFNDCSSASGSLRQINKWSISPDGKFILFNSQYATSGNSPYDYALELGIMDAETGRFKYISKNCARWTNNDRIVDAKFSPDQTKILFTSDYTTNGTYYPSILNVTNTTGTINNIDFNENYNIAFNTQIQLFQWGNLIDNTAPTLSAVTISSNNATSSLAKVGDVVTLSITASESIQTPTVNIGGIAATVSGSGSTYTATATTTSSVTSGTITFTVNYSDLSGNAGTQVTSTTNSSTVTFDKTAPALSAVTISSNNATSSLAKVGDVVTLSITASESIQTPTVNIGGIAATVSGSGSTYTATATTTSSFTSGTITFTVNYSDLSGNAGTQVTSTTNSSTVTFDKTAPALSAVTISSNNATSSLAKVGDVVTLSITASETIQTPTVSIGGITATVSGSGSTYTATATMSSSVSSGTITFSVNYSDLSGNAGAQVTSTTNSSTVTFDKTSPTLSAVTISSNNATSSLAKEGDVVTLCITASETIQTPTVSIGGIAATVSGSGSTYTATATTTSSISSGTLTFTVNYSDLSGNAGTQVTSTTNSSAVTFDKTAPTLSAVTISSNNATSSLAKVGDVVTLSITSSESIQTPTVSIGGIAATVSGSGSTYSATATMSSSVASGTLTYSINYSDLSGNAGTQVTSTTNSSSISFDRTSPTLSSVTISSNNTTSTLAKIGDVVTLSITASESIQTPIVNIGGITATVSNTSGNTWKATATMSSSVASGTLTYSINYSDLSGNAGTQVTSTTNSSTVTFDKTSPTLIALTISSNNATSSLAKVGDVVTLSITASESIQTPIVNIGGITATVSGSGSTYTATATMTSSVTSGTITYSINYSDLSGNAGTQVTSTTNSSSITFDRTSPTLSSVTISSNNTTSTLAKIGDVVTLSITASESIQTPIVNIGGITATVSNTSGNTWKATATMSSSVASGTLTYSINYSDLSGNAGTQVTSTTNSSTVTFDKTSPTLIALTISSNNATSSLAKVGDVVTLSITASESIQTPIVNIGGITATVSGSGSTYTATATMTSSVTSGTITYSINYSDLSGNAGVQVTSTTNSSTVTFDKTAPTLSAVTISSNNATSSLAKVGDVVTLSITSSESIQAPTVSIGGIAATVSGSGSTYTATATMNSSVASGTLTYSINYSDLSGNAGTQVTTTTNSSVVTFDQTVPTLSAVTISSNNATSSLAKVGDVVTLSITASETIQTPTVNIGGISATVSGSGSTYTATATMSSSVASGTITYSINYSDLSGNAGTQVTSTTNSSAVTFDKTAPTLSAVTISSNNATSSLAKVGDVVTLSITSSESIQAPTVSIGGIAATVSGSGSTYTATATMTSSVTSGTITYSINYSDLSGNAGTQVTSTTTNSTVTFDKTSPTLIALTISSNNATSSLAKVGDVVTLSITASESIQTPIVNIGGITATVSGSGSTYTATATMNSSVASGTITYSINYSDLSGNAGTQVTSTTNSSAVTFDKTAPTLSAVTISSNNATSSLAKVGDVVTLSITASETIQTPTVSIGGITATMTGSGSTYTATATMSSSVASGTITFTVNYSDLSGNAGTQVTSTTNSSTVTFDKTAPVISQINLSWGSVLNISEASTSGTISLTTTGVENGQIATITLNSSTYTNTVTNNTASVTIPQSALTALSNGSTYTVTANVSDAAGNAATQASASFIVDKENPSGYSVSWVPTIINNQNYRAVSFVLTNAEVGSTFTYTISGGTASISGNLTVTSTNQSIGSIDTYTIPDGVVNLGVVVKDAAGNIGNLVTASINKATNGAPTGVVLPITISQNDSNRVINLVQGLIDPDNDPLTVNSVQISYSLVNITNNQSLPISTSRQAQFSDIVSPSDLNGNNLSIETIKSKFLPANQKGVISISYIVTDGFNSVSQSTQLEIIGANDQPTGNNVSINQVSVNGSNALVPLIEGLGVSSSVPGVDPDDDLVSYVLDPTSAVANGQFQFQTDGSFVFVPDNDYFGEQAFNYFVKDQTGILQGPYLVKIVIRENPDIDGVPSVLEMLGTDGGDVNGDGVPDRKQNNITTFPITSYTDFQAGLDWANDTTRVKPSASNIGSLLIGFIPNGTGSLKDTSLKLDPFAKFSNVSLAQKPTNVDSTTKFNSDVYSFQIEPMFGKQLTDLDGDSTNGKQTRVILNFPRGVKATTYLKKNTSGKWFSFLDDQNLSTWDEGATLVNLDNDTSTIERIILTIKDGGIGDFDGIVNDTIVDPGAVGFIAPVIEDAILAPKREGLAAGTVLFNINEITTGADTDLEGQALSYKIAAGTDAAILAAVRVDSITGQLQVKNADAFDFETFEQNGIAKFSLYVTATDISGFMSTAKFIVQILNVDEFPRIINDTSFYYNENQPVSVPVTKISALPDYQDVTTYSILPGYNAADFSINNSTGVLSFRNSPNYEANKKYQLDIQAIDMRGNTYHNLYSIYILDVNEAPFELKLAGDSLYENAAKDTLFGRFTSLDIDEVDTAIYSLTSGVGDVDNDKFIVTPTGLLKANNVFDFEIKSTYSIRVSVTDKGGLTFDKVFAIRILDVDEDTDGDGVLDSKELLDGTSPTNFCSFKLPSVSLKPSTNWLKADCDNDGLTNEFEKSIGSNLQLIDTDGDGVNDGKEVADKTDPLNGCSLIVSSQDQAPSDNWKKADCDNDGLSNGVELGLKTNLLQPDTDLDGVIDGTEVADNTLPLDACSLVLLHQTLQPSLTWMNGDCNNDGILNSEVLLVKKNATTAVLQPDGTFKFKYTIFVRNTRPETLTGLVITEDLAKVFGSNMSFVVEAVTVSGNLQRNLGYDGQGSVNVTTSLSTVAGYASDSIQLFVKLQPKGYEGYVSNIASVDAVGKWGKVYRESIDTTVSGGRVTGNGLAAKVWIPKINLIIAGGFSPNNDGVDDKFIILRPWGTTVSLRIFNRWGQIVYQNPNYQNEWDGRGVGNMLGKLLPSGTYFYSVDSFETSGKHQHFSGNVTMVR